MVKIFFKNKIGQMVKVDWPNPVASQNESGQFVGILQKNWGKVGCRAQSIFSPVIIAWCNYDFF